MNEYTLQFTMTTEIKILKKKKVFLFSKEEKKEKTSKWVYNSIAQFQFNLLNSNLPCFASYKSRPISVYPQLYISVAIYFIYWVGLKFPYPDFLA